MKATVSFFSAVLVLGSLATVGHADEVPLAFNGRDLTGWKVPANNVSWRVEDGTLTVRSGPEKRGSILWTEQAYTDFVIECEFRFLEGTVDSGFFMRGEHDQIQIGISGSLKRDMTGSPYIPGKGYPVEAEGVAELLRPDDWNVIRIVARGPRYTVWLNGTQVLDYESDTASEKGPIGIQLHANRDMAMRYRDIRIGALQATAGDVPPSSAPPVTERRP